MAFKNGEPVAAERTVTAILDRVEGVADYPLATTPSGSRHHIRSD